MLLTQFMKPLPAWGYMRQHENNEKAHLWTSSHSSQVIGLFPLVYMAKPRYVLISSASVSYVGGGPSPLCVVVRQRVAKQFVSTT